jgi:NhaP-type Na+/H+ or K+/H+ antiporter
VEAGLNDGLSVPFLLFFIALASGAAEGGQAVQVRFKDAAKHSVEFTEEWGQILNLSVFFLFGVLVARAWPDFNRMHVLYAVLSLTIVRMLPVAAALAGTHLSRATMLFTGWFGPRGLASIVLGLVYLEQELHHSGESTIRLAVMVTVLFSIFAHGMSAMPGMKTYARKISALPPDSPELEGEKSAG